MYCISGLSYTRSVWVQKKSEFKDLWTHDSKREQPGRHVFLWPDLNRHGTLGGNLSRLLLRGTKASGQRMPQPLSDLFHYFSMIGW